MREPIEVNYVPDGDDWQVTASGVGRTLTAKAPGLIAARDRADQLVRTLVPEETGRTVVHLLNGDALAFTSAYLSARLARPTEMPPGGTTPGEPAGTPRPEPGARSEPPAAGTGTTPDPATANPPQVPAPAPSAEQAQKATTS